MSTVSPTYNIDIEQGETFARGFRLRTKEANTNSFASATHAKAQIRETADSNKIIAEFDCEFTANNEELWVTLPANTSQAITVRSGVWDVKVFWPDRVDYVVNGKVKILPRVTR